MEQLGSRNLGCLQFVDTLFAKLRGDAVLQVAAPLSQTNQNELRISMGGVRMDALDGYGWPNQGAGEGAELRHVTLDARP